MSKPHSPGMDASELLDENGTVDHSVIKSITNTGAGGNTRINQDRCDEFRKALRSGATATDTADEFDVGSTTVRRHASGRCHHLESQLSEPSLSFTHGVGWEVDE